MRTRKEQIADLENQFGEEGTFAFLDDRDAATKHILEAEQRGYERARAECAADTRRLDWLGSQDVVIGEFGADKWKEVCLARYQRSMPADLADIRVTIDAAMEGGNG